MDLDRRNFLKYAGIAGIAGGLTLASAKNVLASTVLTNDYIQANSIKAPTGRSAIIVAASNSSTLSKAQADYVCDGVDDNIEIQMAIDSISNIGGSVFLCSGSYYVDDQIAAQAGVFVYSDGAEFLSTVNDYLFYFNKGGTLKTYKKYTGLKGVKIFGSVLNTTGGLVAFDRIYDGILVEDCSVLNTNFLLLNGECSLAQTNNIYVYNPPGNGISLQLGVGDWGPTGAVFDNVCIEHRVSADSVGVLDNSGTPIFQNCYIEDLPISVKIEKTDGSTKFTNCRMGVAAAGDVSFDIYNANYQGVSIQNCMFDVNANGTIFHDRAGGYIPIDFQGNNVMINSNMSTHALFECEADSRVKIDNNEFSGPAIGVLFKTIGGVKAGSFNNNRQMSSGTLYFNIGDYAIWDFLIQNNIMYNATQFRKLSGVQMRNNFIKSVGELQISLESTSVNYIIDNYFTYSTLNMSPGTTNIFRGNRGYITEATGTATITAGQTSVNVSHTLVKAPTRVILSPTTATAGKIYYVSAKAANTFTITIDSEAVADISFDWQAVV